MLLLEIRRCPPYSLLRRKDLDDIRIDSPRALYKVALRCRLGIVQPCIQTIFLLDVEMERRLEDRLRRDRRSLGLATLGLFHPLLSRHDDLMLCQICDSISNKLVDNCCLTVLLPKSSTRYPDLVTGRNHLVRLVEHFLGFDGRLQSREGQPQLDRLRYDFDRTLQQDTSIFGIIFEIYHLFPELDRIWNVFQC